LSFWQAHDNVPVPAHQYVTARSHKHIMAGLPCSTELMSLLRTRWNSFCGFRRQCFGSQPSQPAHGAQKCRAVLISLVRIWCEFGMWSTKLLVIAGLPETHAQARTRASQRRIRAHAHMSDSWMNYTIPCSLTPSTEISMCKSPWYWVSHGNQNCRI